MWVCSVVRGDRGYMPPLRGEEGGTPEYKYSEEMPTCPCGIDRQCLSLFMDEEFDQVRVLFFIVFYFFTKKVDTDRGFFSPCYCSLSWG